jgi:diacylglycerol kinase (ATP)
MSAWIRALLRSFGFAIAGLLWALRRERNLQIHAAITVVVVVLGFSVRLAPWEWCAVLLSCGLVWLAEMLNTALEVLADAVTKEPNELIRRAKDAAAGAVLVAAVMATAVGGVVFLPKLW